MQTLLLLLRKQAVAEYMNEKKREAENIMKVTEIQEMIDGDCEPLAKPHRRFVKESQLTEVSTKGTARKQDVVVFLFNDLLIVTKPQGSSFLSRSKVPKLLFMSSFKLCGSQVSSLDDTPAFPNGFVFMRNASKRTVTLMASTKELRDEWVSSIETEINGATHQEEEQDKRITSVISDKIEGAKAELEKRMSSVLDTHKILSNSDEDIGAPAGNMMYSLSSTSLSLESTDGDLSASTGGTRKSMSLRDKRIALMNQAKKQSSGGTLTSTSVIISADK